MKKTTLLVTMGMILSLSACGKQMPSETIVNETIEESSIETVVETIAETTLEQESSETIQEETMTEVGDLAAECVEIVNEELGYSFPIAKKYEDLLKNSGVETYEDTDFGATIKKVSYYFDFGDVQEPVFSIYELDRYYSMDELEQVNPLMTYLGDNATASLTIFYSQEPSGNLNQEQFDTVFEFMNNSGLDIPLMMSFQK